MVKKETQGERIDLETNIQPSAVSHDQLKEENVKLKEEVRQLRIMTSTVANSVINYLLNADVQIGDAKKICLNALNILNPPQQQGQQPGETERSSNNKAN